MKASRQARGTGVPPPSPTNCEAAPTATLRNSKHLSLSAIRTNTPLSAWTFGNQRRHNCTTRSAAFVNSARAAGVARVIRTLEKSARSKMSQSDKNNGAIRIGERKRARGLLFSAERDDRRHRQ
jgi:hypothetical protein